MKQRLFAVFLALYMLMSLLPISALAAAPGEEKMDVQVCSCTKPCTEEEKDLECPVCRVDATDYSVGTTDSGMVGLGAGDPGTSADNPLEVPTNGLSISGGICTGISRDWFDTINPSQSTVYLSVKIPSNVTTIDTNSFSFSFPANAKLVSLDFSKATALTTIKNQAAMNCSSLTGVLDLSNTNVTTVGVGAFRGCTGLTGVVLPDSLTTLGNMDGSSGSVFFGCSSLRFVTTGDEYNLHKDDPDFTDFSLPDGLITIGKHTFADAFADVDLTLVIPASVTTIGSEAFYPRNNSGDRLSYQPIEMIIVKGTGVSGFDGRAFKFYDSGAPADYHASPRVVVMPDKDTYDAFMTKASGNSQDKDAIAYPLTISYYNSETAEGTPYTTEEKLYKQSIRYTKQGDLWSYDENYTLPAVPGGTDPGPGYTDSVWMMNGKELTVDSTVTSDTVTLVGGDLMEPKVTFTVEHNPRNSGFWTETAANGDTITVNLAEDQSVDIVPNIQHDLAGNEKDDIFFWYRWQDSTGERNNEGEDFTFGETINTLRIDALNENRTSDDNQYYHIDIEGKVVSSGWGPSYNFDGSPIYTSDDHTYHIHVNVVRMENLAYVAASEYHYFIEHDPENYGMSSIYPTAEALIGDYLIGVFGDETYLESDSGKEAELPISWQLKPDTQYSSLPGAENIFVWTVSQADFETLGWTNRNGIPLSGELTLKNPNIIIPNTYTITATAGANGTISPAGEVPVTEGADQSFMITPSAGYHIEDVLVDGTSIGAVNTHTFTQVTGNHTISASFAKDSSGGSSNPGDQDKYTLYYHSNFDRDKQFYQSGNNSRMEVRDYDDMSFLPEREGYTFVCWNTQEDGLGTDYEPGDIYRMDSSVEHLYAQWTQDSYIPGDTGVSDWLDTVNHKAFLSGYPDGTFGTDRNMTRAEVAQMFYSLLLDKDVKITKTFTDVPADAWYADAVNTLASLGMLGGYPDGTFQPNRTITRAEFAVVALAFTDGGSEASCSFTDVSRNDWFYKYVAQASEYGWIGGYPDGSFRPNNKITRAEVPVIVNNMLGRDADERFIDRNSSELVSFTDLTDGHWAYYAVMEATNSHKHSVHNGNESWDSLMTGV